MIQKLSGEQVIAKIHEETDTVMLSFSGGKDSIGAWLALAPHFRVIPYYLYLVPDLSFVNKSLKYYEGFFGQKIIQLPHPSCCRLLRNMVFQPPENCLAIENSGMPQPDYDDQMKLAAKMAGLKNPWVATGLRAADSPLRRIAITKRGAINHNQRKFYPVWDWNKERLLTELKKSGVKLPIDYKLFGRSFDGLDYRFLKPIKDNLPEDYKKILELFPLAELEIYRRERHEAHQTR